MPAANSPLNDEEKNLVTSFLEPLNKNPLASEDLNPMAKVLRKKLGQSEPIPFEEEEPSSQGEEAFDRGDDDIADDSSAPSSSFGEDEDLDEPQRPTFRKFDDDDIDLDEILNEDSPKKEAVSLPTDSDDFPELAKTPEEDPFADFGVDGDKADFSDSGTTSESGDGDIFGGGEASSEADPFADLGSRTDDPFATSTDESKAEDPFADFGGDDDKADFSDSSSSSESGDGDIFGGGEASSEADPFADLGSGTEDPFATISDESKAEDPFADFGGDGDKADLPDSGATESGDGDIFGSDFGSSESDPFSSLEKSDEDPFGGGPAAVQTPSFQSEDMFSDFAPTSSLGEEEKDDFAPPSLDDFGSPSQSIDDDLSSLEEEKEDEEEADAGLSDEDLALIQRALIKFPPKLKRTVVDVIANDRIKRSEQKELLELIKTNPKPEDVAKLLSDFLGDTVDLQETTGQFSPDGVTILSTDPRYTKEGYERQKKVIKYTAAAILLGFLTIFGGYYGYKNVLVPAQASQEYERGLESLSDIMQQTTSLSTKEREEKLKQAEIFFKRGEEIDPDNLYYLNQFANQYNKLGLYDRAFEKLFGKVEPAFPIQKLDSVPPITLGSSFSYSEIRNNKGKIPVLTSEDGIPRKILFSGAYIASRLKYKVHDITTYLNLGKFHSQTQIDFKDYTPYKNDTLAISYYKKIMTDAKDPFSPEAQSGIAKVYYNNGEFGASANWYNKIIETHPKNILGHTGLLSSFIEMYEKDKDPRYVINHHRQIRNALGIEKDLGLYILSKLASFYISLDPDTVNIRYNLSPVDSVTGFDIEDNAIYLLDISFSKTENLNGQSIGFFENLWNEIKMLFGGKDGLIEKRIKGADYAENYYQRGRFYKVLKKENLQALRQFELASSKDRTHYLSVLELAKYYIQVSNFTEASKLLDIAEKRYNAFQSSYGRRDEDEVLKKGDVAEIFFYKGKILFQEANLLSNEKVSNKFLQNKLYPKRSRGELSPSELEAYNRLQISLNYFDKALSMNLRNPALKREAIYTKGWIAYTTDNFEDALQIWSDLEDADADVDPILLLAKGNSFFYTNQIQASMGNYLKLKSDYERKLTKFNKLSYEDSTHQEVVQVLVSVYNNLGACYEKKGNATDALKYYWKAIETAKKVKEPAEIANSNKDMVFRGREIGRDPLLEDWLPASLSSFGSP